MVRSALERTGDLRICAEAADAPIAAKRARRECPDAYLIDSTRPANGMAAASPLELLVAREGPAPD